MQFSSSFELIYRIKQQLQFLAVMNKVYCYCSKKVGILILLEENEGVIAKLCKKCAIIYSQVSDYMCNQVYCTFSGA